MTIKELIKEYGNSIEFFITDENGNELTNDKVGEINAFDNYNSALKKAMKLSKEKEGVYGISLVFNDYKFKNGEIYN